MQIDNITLKDLSIIDGSNSVYQLMNVCTTQIGSEQLLLRIKKPLSTIESIYQRQSHIKFWIKNFGDWPIIISNGTIVMIQKFLESVQYGTSSPSDLNIKVSSLINQFINKEENNYPRFVIEQIHSFLNGCHAILKLYESHEMIEETASFRKNMIAILEQPFIKQLMQENPNNLSIAQLKKYCYQIKRYYKNNIQLLMYDYASIDATFAMAKTTAINNWCIPTVVENEDPQINIEQLYHPLLEDAIANDIKLDQTHTFLFLTGANMAGKSTFLRAIGIATLLAHLGMGIPAQKATISLFKALISNMKVEDNILIGESYFYAEVQRMKLTAEKINAQAPNLILMDEIFKGTNIHDAYDCSLAVIEGLLHNNKNIQILSTHLYELHNKLKEHQKISFKYFETTMDKNDNYSFTYKLKNGVSNDRIGFAVLKQQGVLDLLNPNN